MNYPRPTNPPIPEGWHVVPPHEAVPADVVEWAKSIEHDPVMYPLPDPNSDDGRACIVEDFDGKAWGARVEWHTWIGATGEQRPDGVRGTTVYRIPGLDDQ